MRTLVAILLIGIAMVTPMIEPAVAKSPQVKVPIDIWWAPQPDAKPRLVTVPMQFNTPEIASRVCRSQTSVMKLAQYLQGRDMAFPGFLIGAKCSGDTYATVQPTRTHKPLSPKVLAELQAHNTVQRVTLEIHFRMADGRSKVITSQAQGFGLGDAEKFCAADLTTSSIGIAQELAITDRALARATYVGANCAVDKSGKIRVSTQTYPIEGK